MKKHLLLLLIFVSSTVIAQDKPATEKSKDTIKTEVVEVISSYAPKVTDAFKIKKKPIVELSENTKKKKLKYSILSVPVASTFQPKKGKVKKLEIQERDRIFKNYIAVGFGNYTSPYLETNIKNIDMNNEIGLYGKFTMAIDPVKNTQLSSSYYNAKANAYIKQEDHFF